MAFKKKNKQVPTQIPYLPKLQVYVSNSIVNK